MSELADSPRIDISSERIICPRHGEPFRATWPLGYIRFSLVLMDDIWQNDRVIRAAKRIQGHDGPIDPKVIEGVLDIMPACCQVTDSQLLRAYALSELGSVGRCRHCGKKRRGTRYKSRVGAEIISHRHVCFHCVVHYVPQSN